MYSAESKIFSRSRGLDSSVKSWNPNIEAPAAVMNGAKAAAATFDTLGEQLDVLGMVGELVVADQRAIGLAAGNAELALVDLLEDLALIELDRSR